MNLWESFPVELIEKTDSNLYAMKQYLVDLRKAFDLSSSKLGSNIFVHKKGKACAENVRGQTILKIENGEIPITTEYIKEIYKYLYSLAKEACIKESDYQLMYKLAGIFSFKNCDPFFHFSDDINESKNFLQTKEFKSKDDFDSFVTGFALEDFSPENLILLDYKTCTEAVTKNIKSIRIIANASINEFASILDLKTKAYEHYEYENNDRTLNFERIKKLADYYQEVAHENGEVIEALLLLLHPLYEVNKNIINQNITNYALASKMEGNLKSDLFSFLIKEPYEELKKSEQKVLLKEVRITKK